MGDQLVYADRAEPNRPFRITAVAGETVPYYDSAIGLIIKAANNETIPQEYLTLCNNLARDGYCLKFEPDMDAYCVGIPFLQPGLPCVAGFSVVLPQEFCTPERVTHIVTHTRNAFPVSYTHLQRRFIQHEQLRLTHQRTPDCEHLLLTAGERACRLLHSLLDAREKLVHGFQHFIFLLICTEKRSQIQIFFDAQFREHLSACLLYPSRCV